jgi:hypothetical protein
MLDYLNDTLKGTLCSISSMHGPLLAESFPKMPTTQCEASQFGGSYNYKTKQTTFLHRYMVA